MERLIVLVVLSLAAVAVAYLLQRRRPDPPSAPSYRAPSQLDRSEFAQPDKPVLMVVFASETCSTCPRVWETVSSVGDGDDAVAVQQVTVQADPTLHQRYRIDGVPTTVVADAQGVVLATFFGGVTAEEIEGARDAVALGSESEGHDDGHH